MDAAGRYMREMNKNLGGKFDKMLDKQDQMLGKQDSLQYTVEKGFIDVKEEVHSLRGDL